MRVRQIGTLVFDANTNIVVDANNQDAPGIGFHVNSLYDPQPFAVEIAFRRATRQAALNAVNTLARELHSYAQRRQDERLAIAGGALVRVEDEAGNATLRSFLRDGSVTLLSVETTATGVLARVRVTGTLVAPFLDYTAALNTLSALLPYERRVVALSGLSDAYLYRHWLTYNVTNMNGLYNALLAVEELESATETSRITAINPASDSGGITLQNWDAGWATLKRAQFTSTTAGTITYTVNPAALQHDVYRLFIEIFCPTTPSANARYLVSWDGQPQIAETIVGDRSWYTPALFARNEATFPLTLEVQNVPTGTLVMPLVLIPVDGVSVWSVITPPTLQSFHTLDLQSARFRPFRTNPPGTVYGAPGLITSRYIAVFNGVMVPNITTASSATLDIRSRRIEPAAFA
jgi:hypothetical protein